GNVITPSDSTIKLSTASAQASTGIIELRFTGALDSESASDTATYIVTLNGHSVVVESAAYSATTHIVKLAVADNSLRSGDHINITWHNLKDVTGHTLTSQAAGVGVR
ncbi:MAG: hypothetical protein JOZ57_16165, partial [Abitibacteriaceae bacterium]|nr:hypothetical protein [Abditibacteriaceae bacterium]